MKNNLLKTALIAVLIALSTNLHAFTAVMSGAWSNAATWGGIGPGSTVSNQDIIIPSGITVDLDVEVDFSGLINSFTVDGTLNSTTSNGVTITSGTFAGAGTVDIQRLVFNGLLTTSTFSGTLDLNTLRNMGATIALAAQTSISDSLDLQAGSIALGTGANLTMMANSMTRIDAGTLTSTGGVYSTSTGYDVWYVGTSKTSGIELNTTTLQDLHVNLDDNNQVLTLNINSTTVGGAMTLSAGQVALNGNELILQGDLVTIAGATFVSTATSDLTIEGSGTVTSDLVFSNGSVIDELTLDRSSGNLGLASALSIGGTLHLLDGDFVLESGANLIMNASSTIHIEDGSIMQNGGSFDGTASYNVEFNGGSHASGIELTGSGLNNVQMNLVSGGDTLTLDDDVAIGGQLDMVNGMLALNGNDLTLNGTIDQDASGTFHGDSASILTLNLTASVTDTLYFSTSSNNHLQSLELNIPAASTILLAGSLTIHDELAFMSGRIEITNSTITLRSAASINGYDNNKYIVTSGTGKVELNVNNNATYVTFPVGTMNDYSPAMVSQNSAGNSGMFMVRVMNNVYANGTAGFDASATESVVDQSWFISAAAAVNVNMNLKLAWETTDEVNGFNRNMAYITHYMNNSWDTYLAGAAVAGPNGTYEITRTGITSLSPFAVVDTAAAVGVEEPAFAANVNVFPNPAVDFVTIELGNTANDNFTYEVFDAAGKVVMSFSNANTVNKIDFSVLENGFYFIRITNTADKTFTTKRVVKS